MKKYLFIVLALLIASCEKHILDEEIIMKKDANVILHITQFEQVAFTRAATDITELCTRLNVAIFGTDGTKVKTVVQKDTDSDFGTVALTALPSIPYGKTRTAVLRYTHPTARSSTSHRRA